MPLSFDPGEAYQFDWSHEVVLIDGVTTSVKVAHVRLSHSRMPFVRTYPREKQEMVFDAQDKGFAFFGGACARGIYDNMKTAVDAIFVSKDRPYNRRFQQMCGHYLVDPVACTPASGWEKGQVENQAAVIRQRFFVPRPKFKSYAELNAWLEDRCLAYAKANKHPELTLSILLSFAQFEREVTAERIRDKFRASRMKGIWMGGVPPLGYEVKDRKLIVQEAGAANVRWIFDRFIEIGSGTELARELAARGIQTSRGNRIDKKYLYRMLNNRAYIGEAGHKGTSYPGEHDAIIGRAVWDKVHAILQESPCKRAARTRANTPALLGCCMALTARPSPRPTRARVANSIATISARPF